MKKYFFHPKFKTNRSFNVNTRILKQHGFVNTAETHCIKERNVLLDEVLIGESFLVLISENPLRQSLRKERKKHVNMKSYNLFPTIPLQLVFSVGDINRSRVTHPRVSMPTSVEKPN